MPIKRTLWLLQRKPPVVLSSDAGMENLQFYSSVKKSPSVAPADPAWGHLQTQQLRTRTARLPQTPAPTQRGREDVSDSSQGKDDLQMPNWSRRTRKEKCSFQIDDALWHLPEKTKCSISGTDAPFIICFGSQMRYYFLAL